MSEFNQEKIASNEEILFLCAEIKTQPRPDLQKRARLLENKIKNAISTEMIQKMINDEYLYLKNFSKLNQDGFDQ